MNYAVAPPPTPPARGVRGGEGGKKKRGVERARASCSLFRFLQVFFNGGLGLTMRGGEDDGNETSEYEYESGTDDEGGQAEAIAANADVREKTQADASPDAIRCEMCHCHVPKVRRFLLVCVYAPCLIRGVFDLTLYLLRPTIQCTS